MKLSAADTIVPRPRPAKIYQRIGATETTEARKTLAELDALTGLPPVQ